MYHYLVDDADKPLSEGFWKPSITAVHKTHSKWNIDHGHPTTHSRIVGSIFEKSNCDEHLYFLKSSGGNDRLKSAFTQIVEIPQARVVWNSCAYSKSSSNRRHRFSTRNSQSSRFRYKNRNLIIIRWFSALNDIFAYGLIVLWYDDVYCIILM